MGFWDKLFGKKEPTPDDDGPFMEHPTGEFGTALQAISSAMKRLDKADVGDRWITFSGQGQGNRPDSYQIEDVKFSGRTFDLGGQNVDLKAIFDSTGLAHGGITAETSPDGKVTIPDATPEQLGIFLDALFRKHFGIKPFDDEEDYAVGAEW